MNRIHFQITLDLVRTKESIITKHLNNKEFEWILKNFKLITIDYIKIFFEIKQPLRMKSQIFQS